MSFAAALAANSLTNESLLTLILAGLFCLALVSWSVRKLLFPLNRLRASINQFVEDRSDPDPLFEPESADLRDFKSAFERLAERVKQVQVEHE
ncbi:MAG: hypothetical protein ACREJC_05825, partial [Tepidisphaeraceae bacterium]